MWRWHTISGLIVLPIFALLSITGALFLLQSDYEDIKYSSIKNVQPDQNQVSLQEQLEAATLALGKKPGTYTISNETGKATAFVTGRHGKRSYVMVNPHTGKVTGSYEGGQGVFAVIRKLHGELLLGKFGSYLIELVNSWCFVLLVTGLFVWWPKKKFKLSGFFTIRFNKGKRLLYRDLHTVLGFWSSIMLIIVITSGMMLTVVFGSAFKTIQDETQSVYPDIWRSGKSLNSEISGDPLSLDQMVAIANAQGLPGKLTITLPTKANAVVTLKNRTSLTNQQVIHFDQYSGEILRTVTWDEVGTMAAARSLFMRLHMGSFYGLPYWVLLFSSMVIFTLMSIAGLIAYLIRRPKGKLGLTKVPASFKVNRLTLILIGAFAIILPLFGASLLAIFIGTLAISRISHMKKMRIEAKTA